jgi:hypothetical protein
MRLNVLSYFASMLNIFIYIYIYICGLIIELLSIFARKKNKTLTLTSAVSVWDTKIS